MINKVHKLERGLVLPLKQVGIIEGNDCTPLIRVCRYGVVFSMKDEISLYTHDLSARFWSIKVPGWCEIEIDGDCVLYGPSAGEVGAIDMRGGVRRRIPVDSGPGSPVAVLDDAFVVNHVNKIVCVDVDGSTLWTRAYRGGGEIAYDGHYRIVYSDEGGTFLRCLDLQSGGIVWSYDATVVSGTNAFVIVDGRVVVVSKFGRVEVFDLETGRHTNTAKPPFTGWYRITDESIFFIKPSGMSEFDHRSMTEVDRIDFAADVEALFAGRRPTMHAATVTADSVIWTSEKTIFGVSRQVNQNGFREVWSETIPYALMPLGVAPRTYGRFMYWRNAGQIIAWESV